MLGPVLICHKKDEHSVKLLCDSIISKYPGLKNHLKVLGADGENSILNQTCNEFTSALLLMCTKHVKDNIKQKLPNIEEHEKKEMINDLFGTMNVKGVVDSIDMDEFDRRMKTFYSKWEVQRNCGAFLKYLRTHKEDILKFHVTEGVVKAAEICDSPQRFYNNNMESINNLIKKRQDNRKVDLYSFSKEYQTLADC